jgi:hypothetical protein
MKRSILSAFLAVALLAPVASQADHTTKLINHAQVSFSAPDADKVHDAIVSVGKSHGWVASNEQPGRMTLSNTIRGTFIVVLDVTYSPSGMQVDYVSSENLNYKLKNDVPYIHPKYNKWVDLLMTETKQRLST